MTLSNSNLGILCVLGAGLAFSINDIAIKFFTHLMPLHEVVLFRAVFALILTVSIFVPAEGGLKALKTRRPILHICRGLLLVLANLSFFSGLAVLSLADCTAIFFIAPLLITALSKIFLNEPVGYKRWLALLVGMMGVLFIIKPGAISFTWSILLPLIAAITYACNNLIARKMGLSEKASTMSFYIHSTFIIICGLMGLFFGTGIMAGSKNPALEFVFRSWIVPDTKMITIIFVAGLGSAFGGYLISQAYRLCSASTVAPFEYSTLILAVFWGFSLWRETPDISSLFGIILIVISGVFIAKSSIGNEIIPSVQKVSSRR